MVWDYLAWLAQQSNFQESALPPKGLAGGFVDEVSVRFLCGDKKNARNRYMQSAQGDVQMPCLLRETIPNFAGILQSSWLGLQVDFELLTPWSSKDDRVFHVLDNPVRKDRVFGVPFMAASSWKGMVRWACRIQEGLRDYQDKHEGKMDGWQDPPWILHLFGSEKGKGEEFHQSALVFYPTWFDKIGFEVINPHSRERRAGIQPIYYEVVPPGAKGTFSLLYAPWPGMKPSAKPQEVLPLLLEAIETLLTTYGISAKRTVGWGTARIEKWRAYKKGKDPAEKEGREDLWNEIRSWLTKGGNP